MGGSNETKINGLRMHINNNVVHIHDDSKSLKFELPKNTFKRSVKKAIEDLVSEGIIEIPGTTNIGLCIMKGEKSMSIFLIDDKTSIKNELNLFLESC